MGSVKDFLKRTPLWIWISYSMPYQRIRMPENYKRMMREKLFYQRVLKDLDRDLVFDVGANVGDKSYIFSALGKKVVAFEPSKKCIHIVRSRFWNKEVEVIPVALGSSKGELDYYGIADNEAYSTLNEKHLQTTVKERMGTTTSHLSVEKIQVDTLDYFIQMYGVPGYIKIDVEGYELEVLKGLHTIVPLISFEANLPEFRDEAIEGIQHLIKIGGGRYRFNFAVDTSFHFDSPVDSDAALHFLRDTSLRYLEIYAWS